MTEKEYLEAFEILADKLSTLPEEDVAIYHEQLHALVLKARAVGIPLTDRLNQLDERLQEAAIEAQFDNMPV